MKHESNPEPLLVAIVGPPHSGKKALASALAELTGTRLMTGEDFRTVLENSSSAQAVAARDVISSGQVLTPAARSAIWVETLPESSDVILPGFPLTKAELEELEACTMHRVVLVVLQASVELIDQRRQAAGLPGMEESYPGAVQRAQKSISEMIHGDRPLLEIGAAGTANELARVVAKKYWPDVVETND